MRWQTLALVLPIAAKGCFPGCFPTSPAPPKEQITTLQIDDVAVDGRTSRSYVLTESSQGGSTLYTVSYSDCQMVEIPIALRTEQVKILFPASKVMIKSEYEKYEEVWLLDKDNPSNGMIQQASSDTVHGDLRMSPSGKWMIAPVKDSPRESIDIINTADFTQQDALSQVRTAYGADELEATWIDEKASYNPGETPVESLLAILFTAGSQPSAQLLVWPISAAWNGELGEPMYQLELPDVQPERLFSSASVVVSPNGEWAAVALMTTGDPATLQLHVVNTKKGTKTVFDKVFGPFGFTPDSSTIVAFDNKATDDGDGGANRRLLLIDVNKLDTDPQPMTPPVDTVTPLDVDYVSDTSYFISASGDVVVASRATKTPANMTLYRLAGANAPARKVEIEDSKSVLSEFVNRKCPNPTDNACLTNQLWFIDGDKTLRMVDLSADKPTVTAIDSNKYSHINILPNGDLLVLTKANDTTMGSPLLYYLEPSSMQPATCPPETP